MHKYMLQLAYSLKSLKTSHYYTHYSYRYLLDGTNYVCCCISFIHVQLAMWYTITIILLLNFFWLLCYGNGLLHGHDELSTGQCWYTSLYSSQLMQGWTPECHFLPDRKISSQHQCYRQGRKNTIALCLQVQYWFNMLLHTESQLNAHSHFVY